LVRHRCAPRIKNRAEAAAAGKENLFLNQETEKKVRNLGARRSRTCQKGKQIHLGKSLAANFCASPRDFRGLEAEEQGKLGMLERGKQANPAGEIESRETKLYGRFIYDEPTSRNKKQQR